MICIHSKNVGFITVLLILKLSYGVQSFRKVSNTTLPVKGDVIVYLKSIERVLEFCKTHTTDIDLNVGFGLFLLNEKFDSAYVAASELNTDRARKQCFTRVLPRHGKQRPGPCGDCREEKSMEGYPMRSNTMKVLTRRKELILRNFPSWKGYVRQVNDFFKSSPTPVQSDRCLDALGRSPSKTYGPPYRCSTVPIECNRLIYNGTDFGYAVAHRLLFLLAARYGRRCYVYSPIVDSRLVSNFCSAMYNEAQYIAANSYMNADLFMEQMLLCTIAGHADFLQRKWLATMLQLQTSFGCFKIHRHSFLRWEQPTKLAEAKWQLAKNGTQAIMGGECNGHMTAVAAATLSVAVRYIIETYY